MKNKLTLSLVFAISLSIGLSKAQEKLIAYQQLPQPAKNFIEKQFSDLKVSVISLEKELLQGNTFNVLFTNGTSLEFDKKGNWTELDGKMNPIPAQLIPPTIVSHIQKSFPNNHIVQIKKEKTGYEVELTNGIDLKYNRKGEFIKIDD
ncbi:PepSY-like domain-containing protein [Sphingobacterium sp. HJSM2_6]|uniref:PepSY-like domain-containing protein n=1 Tax=Sphingobacterium sp. HJSM2_6 TaxID=3366264 RepID=UPI003BE29F02